MPHTRYDDGFLDWLGCAIGGMSRGTFADLTTHTDGLGGGAVEDVVRVATAGHVLDFDDTYTPGLSHLSAATAPVAVVLAVRLGRSVGDMLTAYAKGFEAMARVSRSAHPRLYDAGWHPTSVCGAIGAAVTAADLLGLDTSRARHAVRLSLLTASGMRSAFGTHGKAAQVGLAAGKGVLAARLAANGTEASDAVIAGPASAADVYGLDAAAAFEPDDGAVDHNWLKAYPCCLQTHAPVDLGLAALDSGVRPTGSGTVVVHPVSRQAARYDDVTTGLEAKFSIPYTTAWAMLRGAPTLQAFETVDDGVRNLAGRIHVETDSRLEPNGARFGWRDEDGEHHFEVVRPRGSPENPMSLAERSVKLRALGGDSLIESLVDREAGLKEIARALRL